MLFRALFVMMLVMMLLVSEATGLKVVGVGLGRTGTESLKQALIEMGFGPAYHMVEVLVEDQGVSTAGHIPLWHAAARGEHVDWAMMLKDFNSGCDWPMASFPEEMLKAFPDAKFVLTMRTKEQWWASIQSSICWVNTKTSWQFKVLTLLPIFPFSRIKEQSPMMDDIVKFKIRGGLDSWDDLCKPANKELTLAAYDAHIEKVKKLIPSNQLLVFETGKSTYADLADFLGVPVPSQTYPKVNSKAEWGKLKIGATVAAGLVLLSPLLAFLLVNRLVNPGQSSSFIFSISVLFVFLFFFFICVCEERFWHALTSARLNPHGPAA